MSCILFKVNLTVRFYQIIMNRIFFSFVFLIISSVAISQSATPTVAHVDKKTKEFFVSSNPKAEFKIFGYEYPNVTTRKMICFSSYTYDVGANINNCPLGSYFDSGKMKEGDRIRLFRQSRSFSKMMFTSGSGKKTIFYFPKGSFTLK